MGAELHVASNDLIVVRLLCFDFQQPEIVRRRGTHEVVADLLLVPRVSFRDEAHAFQWVLLDWFQSFPWRRGLASQRRRYLACHSRQKVS